MNFFISSCLLTPKNRDMLDDAIRVSIPFGYIVFKKNSEIRVLVNIIPCFGAKKKAPLKGKVKLPSIITNYGKLKELASSILYLEREKSSVSMVKSTRSSLGIMATSASYTYSKHMACICL